MRRRMDETYHSLENLTERIQDPQTRFIPSADTITQELALMCAVHNIKKAAEQRIPLPSGD